MKFNSDKCSVMHCGCNNVNNTYKLYDKEICVTDSEKDLGVIIDKNMKFTSQVASQVKKANKVLGMIKRNFEIGSKEVFQLLYSTLVRPHLEYAVQVWNPHCQGQKKKLEQVQRRATKMVRELRKFSYEERIKNLNLMSTESRRRRGDMIMTFKILKEKVKTNKGLFNKSAETRTRGHNIKLAKAHRHVQK